MHLAQIANNVSKWSYKETKTTLRKTQKVLFDNKLLHVGKQHLHIHTRTQKPIFLFTIYLFIYIETKRKKTLKSHKTKVKTNNSFYKYK